MAHRRKRLETERACEALAKAAGAYKTLTDLPRLDTAISNAKRVIAVVHVQVEPYSLY